MSTKPAPWTLSPQLTAAPELWRGLEAVFPLWEGTGDPQMLGDMPVTTDLQIATWGKTLNGASVNGDGSAFSYVRSTQFPDVGPTNWTFVVSGVSGSNSQERFHNLLINGESNSIREQKMMIAARNGSQLQAGIGDGNGNQASGAKFDVLKGNPFCIVVVYNGSVVKVFKNGDLIDSFSSSLQTNTISKFAVMGDPEKNLEWIGSVDFVSAYSRAVTDQEARFITTDPFAMLRPAGF